MANNNEPNNATCSALDLDPSARLGQDHESLDSTDANLAPLRQDQESLESMDANLTPRGQDPGSLDPMDAKSTTYPARFGRVMDPSLSNRVDNSSALIHLPPSLSSDDLLASALTEAYSLTNPFVHAQPGWRDDLNTPSALSPTP
jgi:hypothetical protein